MKVVFEYFPQGDGHRLSMECKEVPTLPNSDAFDSEEYYQCFKAIQKQVEDIIELHEEKRRKIANSAV